MVLFFDGVKDFGMQMFEIVGNKVGQVAVLGVIPTLLDRIQFWGVLREPLELEPIGMIFLEVGSRRAVRHPAIPYQNHPPTTMFM